ncbi:MAG: nuclear transport factor 2 family protein, partial [Pseudomonadota bacterium]
AKPKLETCPMSDLAEIEATVEAYFEGYKAKDATLLRRAFAEGTGSMIGFSRKGDGESLIEVTLDDRVATWSDPGYATPELGPGRILSVTQPDPMCATVVLDFGGKFVDTLGLAKIGGTWKIVHKFFVHA